MFHYFTSRNEVYSEEKGGAGDTFEPEKEYAGSSP